MIGLPTAEKVTDELSAAKPVETCSRVETSHSCLPVLVRRRPINCRDLRINHAQIDRELTAMMGQMTEDRVRNHDVARILRERCAAHFESPRLSQMFVGCGLKSTACIGHGAVEACKKFGSAGKWFSSKGGRLWSFEVEFVAIDNKGDPAQHACDEG